MKRVGRERPLVGEEGGKRETTSWRRGWEERGHKLVKRVGRERPLVGEEGGKRETTS